jgi:hypothetical protein
MVAEMDCMVHELEIMGRLSHPNVVSDVFQPLVVKTQLHSQLHAPLEAGAPGAPLGLPGCLDKHTCKQPSVVSWFG